MEGRPSADRQTDTTRRRHHLHRHNGVDHDEDVICIDCSDSYDGLVASRHVSQVPRLASRTPKVTYTLDSHMGEFERDASEPRGEETAVRGQGSESQGQGSVDESHSPTGLRRVNARRHGSVQGKTCSYRQAVGSTVNTPSGSSGEPTRRQPSPSPETVNLERLRARVEASTHVDWTENAIHESHVWTDPHSNDPCYLAEKECSKSGPRKRCSACHITAHVACIPQQVIKCKPTFREAGVRNYREQQFMRHHWTHRRRQEGRCRECLKSFQAMFKFPSNKEIVAISCSWCKRAHHNRTTCFTLEMIEEECHLGPHGPLLIPPSWIIKIPRKMPSERSIHLALKSSVKKRSKRKSVRKKSTEFEYHPFIIKPIPGPNQKPLLVFVNPKSGGNQGARIIHKFNWLLNPRQVFDLSLGGPRKGLELFRKIPNLHILVCGGDGTVGWVLAEIDEMGITPPPSVAILPLGTGNDLSRTLNWGSGYTDEPMSKVLAHVEEASVVQLDRWDISSRPLPPCPSALNLSNSEWNPEGCTAVTAGPGDDKALPLSVMNNYFSLGADAHVQLEFHSSREANPEKFQSRSKNKMYYAYAGSKGLLKRPWKDLSEHITIICDGRDITPRVQELKLHCLLLLNIPKYSSGTTPWSSAPSAHFATPRHDDGLLEVVGFTMTQLATVQVGGHGERLAQCREVVITNRISIPMQVDGEPCRLAPSTVLICLRNRANMLARSKRGQLPRDVVDTSQRVKVAVSRISLIDYETYHYDRDRLRAVSVPLGVMSVEVGSCLEKLRDQIDRLAADIVSAEEVKAEQSDQTRAPLPVENRSPLPLRNQVTAAGARTKDRPTTNGKSAMIESVDPKSLTGQSNNNLSSQKILSSQSTGVTEGDSPPVSMGDQSTHSGLGSQLLHVGGERDVEGGRVRFLPSDDSFDVKSESEMSEVKGRELANRKTRPLSLQPLGRAWSYLDSTTAERFFRVDRAQEHLHYVTDIASDELFILDPSLFSVSSLELERPLVAPMSPIRGDDGGGAQGSLPITPPRSPLQAPGEGRKETLVEKALHDAAKRGDLKRFMEAAKNGADMMSFDKNGMTVLHNAARFGHKDIVRHIVDHGPKDIIDIPDAEKAQTPLHKAAWYQRRTISRILVAAGASLTKTDLHGYTPKAQALRADDLELASYLESQEIFRDLNEADDTKGPSQSSTV